VTHERIVDVTLNLHHIITFTTVDRSDTPITANYDDVMMTVKGKEIPYSVMSV